MDTKHESLPRPWTFPSTISGSSRPSRGLVVGPPYHQCTRQDPVLVARRTVTAGIVMYTSASLSHSVCTRHWESLDSSGTGSWTTARTGYVFLVWFPPKETSQRVLRFTGLKTKREQLYVLQFCVDSLEPSDVSQVHRSTPEVLSFSDLTTEL